MGQFIYPKQILKKIFQGTSVICSSHSRLMVEIISVTQQTPWSTANVKEDNKGGNGLLCEENHS